jgi:uncharacterized protein (DUF1778 family)
LTYRVFTGQKGLSEREGTMTKPPENRRTERIEVSLTEGEKAEIVVAAASEGLQAGTFIRMAALQMARGSST